MIRMRLPAVMRKGDDRPDWSNGQLHRYSNVRIHISPGCPNDGSRIEMSNGTRVATPGEVRDLGYEDGARLPCGPWRPLTRWESDRLMLTKVPDSMAESICLLRLPWLSTETRDAIAANDMDAVRDNVVAPISRICRLDEPLDVIGVAGHPPGRETVTIDRDVGKSIGLHVDSWDNLDLEQRGKSTNRICVNVGYGHRYFLFLPFSLMEIASILSKETDTGPASLLPSNLFERTFMDKFPHVPVVRCRLAPGDAYIAPTENLIHDGSSEGGHDMDVTFTIRGHLGLPK